MAAWPRTLDNLGDVFEAQGRYDDAEPLFRRGLAIREKALRPDHPDLADSLNRLAAVHRIQGRPASAEPLHRRALDILEQGTGHRSPERGSNFE
jgi:tetratricopeptide (TPR) repeat protein